MKINKDYLWDYDFKEKDFETESFKKWYIGRILVKGNIEDIKDIGYELINQYFPKLTIPYQIRKYWEWFLKEGGYKDDFKQRSEKNSYHNIRSPFIKR